MTQFGHYTVLETIAHTAHSDIFKALDTDGLIVAIKTANREALLHEKNILEQLGSHPDIITLRGSDLESDPPYLVLDHINGSVADLLKDGTPIPFPYAAEITQSLLRALVHAHEKGIIHGDIKPANILAQGNLIKVCDFGLAKLEERLQDSLTSATTSGTFAYLAPEVKNGKQQPSPQSDIFATGHVLYHMLTGNIREALSPAPSTIAQVPLAIDHFINTCMAIDPAKRYTSAHDALSAFYDISNSPTPSLSSRIGTFIKKYQKQSTLFVTALVLSGAITIKSCTNSPLIKTNDQYWYQIEQKTNNNMLSFPVGLDPSYGTTRTVAIETDAIESLAELLRTAEANDRFNKSPILYDKEKQWQRVSYTPRQVDELLRSLERDEKIAAETVHTALSRSRQTRSGYDDIMTFCKPGKK